MTVPTLPVGAEPATIDCETAVRRLWDFLDGRLPAMAHAEVELHLATCLRCPPHFEFARKMQVALAAARGGENSVEGEATTALRERVRSALRRQRAME
jgi:anti-sigma factor RsiW